MRLPSELSLAMQREIEKIDPAQLLKAVEHLIQRYQAGNFSSPVVTTPAQRAAYLALRLPATFAANMRVFSEIRRLAPEAAVTSILDLAAGPGTSLHAAAEVFESMDSYAAVETDTGFIELGRRLSSHNPAAPLRNARWSQRDLKAGSEFEPAGLVVISYALNELSPSATAIVVQGAWRSARELLALIEPGSVRGFACIDAARSQLIAEGAHILAPCPHAAECPMSAAKDWCHFAQRLERTSMHRRLKGGRLGYEDEKFSYLVAGRRPFTPVPARIVRHPQKHSGHVQLTLCTLQGLEEKTIGRSKKEAYKMARQAEWGDGWIGFEQK